MPRRGVVYRCHVCRLELTLDETRGKLDVPPVDPPDRHNRLSPAKSASKRRKAS
jgi:hypothetical protein